MIGTIRGHGASTFLGVLMAAFAGNIARSDVVISNDATQNITCSAGSCAPTATDAVLNLNDLSNMLANGNVSITTYIAQKEDALNIDLIVPLGWTSSNKLTLNATRTVAVNAPITVMGAGGLTITNQYSFELSSASSITFWDLGSSFVTGGISYTLVGDIPTLLSDIASNRRGFYALANDYDAKGDVLGKPPILFGAFEGLGHSVLNLTVKKGVKNCEGLFSVNRAVLRDFHLRALNVLSKEEANIGGVAGCNYGSIQNVTVDGTIAGSSTANVGGIAGLNTNNITGSSAVVSVSGGQAGGLVGENDRVIAQSFANGSVSGNTNSGGLTGANRYLVQDSYAIVAVSGHGGAAGGLVGFNDSKVLHCYSTGTVTGADGLTGGFVGYDPDETVAVSYWDVDTSGLNQGAGFPASDPGIAGLTTTELQSRLPSGFRKSIWAVDSGINNGFPYLRSNPPQ